MQKYVKDHGLEYIRPALEQKVDEMGEKSGVQMLYDFSISKDMVRSTVKSFMPMQWKIIWTDSCRRSIWRRSSRTRSTPWMSWNWRTWMLSVMKKELNTIVNLGALIGFVIGILNIFI